LLPDLTEIRMYAQIEAELSRVSCNENLCCSPWVVTCGMADRYGEANWRVLAIFLCKLAKNDTTM
jgi:hypothetical protein